MKRRLNNEEQLYHELSQFFKRLKKEVLKGLEEYWSEYQMLQGHINLIVSPVHEAHKEYYEILKKYKLREYKLGKQEATRLVNRAGVRYAFKEAKTMPINGFIKKNSNELFGTLPKAEQDLLTRTYQTSEKTLSRVDSQLNQIITDGYRSGKGINDISNQITRRFDQLESWEAKRIARTEVNTSHNKATMDTYQDMGVEYTQWIAASDDRTRDSHVEVDGEIIPMGGKYSNGLEYPGDMSGPIEEWINCRCSNAPFVIPYGYMAPSFSPFREEDLIPIETHNPLEQTEPQPVEPTEEQIKNNLTPEEQAQYERLLPRDIETYRQNIEVTFRDDPKLVDFFKGKLNEAESKLEQLKQKALNPEPVKEFKISPLEDYTLETMRKDIPLEDKTFDKLVDWSYKRATTNKIEYGYQFDTSTGKIIGEEVRGKKGSVTFTQQGTNIGSFHTHPPVEVDGMDVGGGSFPSKQDLKVYRSQRGADHLLGSPTEVWYVHAEENLNSGVLGQREIDAVYNKVYKEVGEKGQKLVREGKLKTDDASLRKFMDKEIGDGLLREFNTKEWRNKGFYIRRAYR